MSLEEESPAMSVEEEEAEVYADEEGIVDDAGEEEEEAEQGAVGNGMNGIYNCREVNDQVFEELVLPAEAVQEVQYLWGEFQKAIGSREATGEAIYSALFDAAPSIQSLFKTPRAVMSMRFMNGINQIINATHDPKGLKVIVETLAFQHLDLEVTIPRTIIFRDAIVDLIGVELGARLTNMAKEGLETVLNYVGGAYIFVRLKFSERLRVLQTSWASASKRNASLEDGEEEAGDGSEPPASSPPEEKSGKKREGSSKKKSWFGKSGTSAAAGNQNSGEGDFRNNLVPQTYNDMFTFNAAVMGFGNNGWMNEVLASFDTIVTNVSNSYRLQEECDVLGLRLAKFKSTINLGEYKAVMLASLRSLVKEWGSQHEIAWSWLWENVERMIKQLMGKPAQQEKCLARLFESLDETALSIVRREVYSKFFAMAPAGQEYFKQSTTRLHFIADKVVAMTLEMYRDPKKMVEDLSALGLRHVGYGIPTDLFGPFVTACVQVVRTLTDDDAAEEAFRWSLNLISRILTRVINEGSTVVMKAINANSDRQLRRAVSCAPRGQRSLWMLNVQVGTQSISPILWAIETGSLEAARAIFLDLLTIRADRDRYYFGMDILFERHPDIVKCLCMDAPALLPVLLDGLIWRSRTTEGGQRRVVYYIKHMVVDAEGGFAKNLEWLVDNADPKLICHPLVATVTDLVWARVAFRTFLYGRAWFLFTLSIFVLSQSVLNHLGTTSTESSSSVSSAAHRLLGTLFVADSDATTTVPASVSLAESDKPEDIRITIFCCRCFIYLCSMGQWIIFHMTNMIRDCRRGALEQYGCVKIPEYMANWQGIASLLLTVFLLIMLVLEPILHCMPDNHGVMFTDNCPSSDNLLLAYSVVSMAAMMMYFLLLTDLSVFSTQISAFALVCARVLSELALFGVGLLFVIVAFACSICALEQDDPDFKGVPAASINLFKITVGMFSGSHFDLLQEESAALLICVCGYNVVTVIFMLNLLVAQLNCAYSETYMDMMGFARLNRGKIVCETMANVSQKRWSNFVESLHLDERVEFGEGDIGLAGGIQMVEPASANITTVDMIKRYGGSTSPSEQWPEEAAGADEDDRFERLEKLITKSMKRLTTSKGGSKASTLGSELSDGGSVRQSGSS